MKFLKWPIENPVFVNMLTVLFFVIGLLCLQMMPQEESPEISLNWVNITVLYDGASPEDMENLVTKKVEDELAELDDIESVTSWSGEGYSRISIKYADIPDETFERRYQELVTEINAVSLPAGAEDPIYFKWSSSTFIPALNISIYGDASEFELKKYAKNLKDKLSDKKNISKINIAGERDEEIWIELIPERLKTLGVGFSQIQSAIQSKNFNVTAGSIKNGSKEFVVRSLGEFTTNEQILETNIYSDKNRIVRVKDVAKVSRQFKKAASKSRFNGKQAITLALFKKPGHGTMTVINELYSIIEEEKKSLPDGIFIEGSGDITHRISEGIGVLNSNALAGVILVMFLLHLFLGTRNAIFAAVGIPTSFVITFIFLYATDQTMNLSVMFGMVLVLGMIVDDAMVIIENVYRHMENGKGLMEAVLKGVPEVAKPVSSSIATTVAAFLPLMLMPGIMGKFMRVIPFVVCLALLASIVEAFFIMPVHIARMGKLNKKEPKGEKYVVKMRKVYDKLLKVAIEGRGYLIIFVIYLFLIGVGFIAEGAEMAISALMFVLLLITTLVAVVIKSFKKRYIIPLLITAVIGSGLIHYKKISVEMFADEPLNMIFIRVKAPQGTNLDEMERIIHQYETKALELPKHEVRNVVSKVGVLNLDTEVINGSNVGEVIVDIAPNSLQEEQGIESPRKIQLLIDDLKQSTKGIQGVEWVAILFPNTGPPAGKPVEVKILGDEFSTLREIADKMEAFLQTVEGLTNIDNDFVEGKEEFRFYPNDYNVTYSNLSNIEINQQLAKMLTGQPVGIVREADEEIALVLKYPEETVKTKDQVKNLRITNALGQEIPLYNLGEFKEVRSLSTIKRYRRKRAITVSADLDESGKATSVSASTDLKKYWNSIEAEYPGYRISFEGEFKEFEKAFASLTTLFLVGIGLMFIILGTQFKSWLRPIMILLSVPVAFVGATFGLAVSGNSFSIGAMFGMVALAGVAVNSAIVLVDFIAKEREKGLSLKDAVLSAGHIRFRPIILTSFTTVFGMLPLAIGLGGSSVSWQPLAVTIVCGLLVSTVLTLFLIPSFYILVEDYLKFYQRAGWFRILFRGIFSTIGIMAFVSMALSGTAIMGAVILSIMLMIGFIADLEVHDRK